MSFENIDDILAADARGELPAGVKTVDMRNAAFAVVAQWDGRMTMQVKCDDSEFVRCLREIADEVEARAFKAQLDQLDQPCDCGCNEEEDE
jgi:hypothetical protein